MKKGRRIAVSRELRQSQTDAEGTLWNKLRTRQLQGTKFRRQQVVGPYIVDLVSFERKLVIEIDGGQHNEEQAQQRDELRTAWLEEEGFKVLRFWNNEVLNNIDGVLEKIRESIG